MSLSKKIYTRAKTHFKNNLDEALVKALKLPGDPFVSNGNKADINNLENSFAIVSARYLINDTVAMTDPDDNKEDYQNFVKALRLNDFRSSNKAIDAGTGIGSSNNLLYRLALKFLKDKGQNISNLKAKLSIINAAFADPEFESEFLRERFLTDQETFECVTKQAFYKWHYSTYIANTSLEDRVRQENAVDKSISGWDKLVINNLTSKSLNGQNFVNHFVSRAGSPFNTGYPVVCSVFEVGGIDNLSNFVNSERMSQIKEKIYEDISALFDRDLFESVLPSRVKKITHNGKTNIDIVEDVKVSKGGKSIVRFCIAFDYASLILGKRNPDVPTSQIGNVKDELNKQKNLVITFNTAGSIPTDVVIQDQIEKLSPILEIYQPALESLPAIFIDKDSESLEATRQFYTSEGLDKQSIDSIFSTRYDLNLEAISKSLINEYRFLLNEYRKARLRSDIFLNYNPARITEDISFYYDTSYQLLAIVSNNRENFYNVEVTPAPPQQKNSVPFEFSLEPAPLSELDPIFSISKQVNNSLPDPGEISSGIDGDLVFITEFFEDKLINSKNIEYDRGDFGSYVITNQHYQNTLVAATKYPFTLINSVINGFFYFSNEIILIESAGTNPSFNSAGLQKDISDIQFLLGNKTYEEVNAIPKSIDEFLLRYHFPRVQIKPSFLDIADDELANINQKLETAKRLTRKLTNIGNKIVSSVSEADLIKQIEQPRDEYFYNTKEKLLFEAQKQISIVAAATTNDPTLKDLSSIINSGDLDQIYNKILTKFDWSELLAKDLQNNLSGIQQTINSLEKISASDADKVLSNGADKLASDVANGVAKIANACIEDLGPDVLQAIDSVKGYKKAFEDIKNFIEKDLKELIGIGDKIDYLFVLDFQSAIRDRLEEEAQKIALQAISSILSTIVNGIQDLSQKTFAGAQEFIDDQLTGGIDAAKDILGGQIDSLNSIGSNPLVSQQSEQLISIDLIAMLKRSSVESLQSILNGAVEIYTTLANDKASINKSQIIEEYLTLLGDNLTVPEFQNLLQGVVTSDVAKLNQIIADDLPDITSATKNEMKNETNLITLFVFLNQFLSNTVVSQVVLSPLSRRTNPCFVNLTSPDTPERTLFDDFILTSANKEETILDKINSLVDSINKACNDINSVYENITNSSADLLNDQDKKELIQNTENLIEANNSLPSLIVQGVSGFKTLPANVTSLNASKLATDYNNPFLTFDKQYKFFLNNDGTKIGFFKKQSPSLFSEFIKTLTGSSSETDRQNDYQKIITKLAGCRLVSPEGATVLANLTDAPGAKDKGFNTSLSLLDVKRIANGYITGIGAADLSSFPAVDGSGNPINEDRIDLVSKGDKIDIVLSTLGSYTEKTGISQQETVLSEPKFSPSKLIGTDAPQTLNFASSVLATGLFLIVRDSFDIKQTTFLRGLLKDYSESGEIVAAKVAARLESTLDDSTADSEYYTNNMFKMQKIIKNLKEQP